MRRPMTLYTCLLEEFSIYEFIKIEFKIENIYFEDVLYVLLKRCDEIVILGRTWMSNKPRGYKSFSLRSAPDELCKVKEEGIKGFECEINTKPAKSDRSSI
ncbi:hypothetical protein NGRA_2664 [Nosema granulosis]|uniref:Uncharacterized protein n=1 Tax=Nosema granulosis TaxID=83296 RepID=A0A9P6KY81_9MICR|nr:hypothetical protein NGRA_2664 [Nosema granulosis]